LETWKGREKKGTGHLGVSKGKGRLKVASFYMGVTPFQGKHQ